MPPEDYKIDYKTEYLAQKANIQSLESENRELRIENKKLEVENRKLKTIIASILEEKYCKDGD